MKAISNFIRVMILVLSIGTTSLFAQTAKIQIIHNSADALAQSVDIYVNDSKLIENFQFRTATKFFDVPAGVDLKVTIVPRTFETPNELQWEQTVSFERDEQYIIIANGLLDETRYTPFQPFAVYPFAGARTESINAVDGNLDIEQRFTDVLVFHGSTDAPNVNVVESGVGAGTIISDFAYGTYAGYLSLPTNDYVLQVTNVDETVVVAQYTAPLKSLGLENMALTVLASGFLSPADNYNGSAFGLYVALPSGGDLIPLPLVETENRNTARVQVIHNSADAAAAVVDVWLNQTKLIENFAFRTATPFIDAPAGVLLNIGIAPANSTSWTQSFRIKQVVLTENETYVIVAGGIVSASGYNPSPIFDVKVYPIGRETASQKGNTDVLVIHGSTDAPTVDIYETGVGAGLIVDDLTYGNVAGYLELGTLDYIIEVRDATGTVTVAAYSAPLATLGLEGAALSVLASGFLNPSNNSNGAPFGLYVALPSGGDLIPLPLYQPAQTARVQVIHNSADAAAAMVDVWLNDTKLIENFAFRSATPFIDAPAGVEFTIAIQGPGSTSPANPIWSQNYTLADGETYVLVANGIVSASGYEPSQPFDIYVYAMGQEAAMQAGNTDVLAFHGSTDAPTVSVWETGVGAGEIISDFSYGDFDGYLELPTLDFVLEVRDATGTVTVAAYAAPLATLGLEGAALSVIASGFLNPANNSNGEAFGLYVALPSGGDLIALPAYVAPSARVQVIHNSADAAAAVVDVWLNDAKLIENFAFRTATPFIDAPAGVEFTIAIQGPGSTSAENPIWSQNYTLADGETYVLVANGIVSASGYEPSQPFDIYVYPMGQEAAMQAGNTDVLAFHGSTDAPTVSVWETGVGAGEIISDFSYGDFAGYLELPTLDFVLEVRDETGTVTVAAYAAPLATLGLEGAALSVIASGFLNPANNSNGEAFGLYVALPSGGDLIPLPVYTPTARVQVIHNSADAAAAVVDVWLNDTKLIENFAFRTATPFIDAPAGVEFTIAIQGPGSTSAENPIWSQDYTLADGETYVLVANGIVSASGYEPSQPFDIYVYGMGRETASSSGNTDVLAFHGSTDAPTVSVWEVGVGAGQIISDFSYGDFDGYLELPTANYSLQIRDAAGETAVATFSAPLETFGLGGQAITLLASGFLNPTVNSNGAGFGLFAALAAGGNLVELTNTSSINDIVDVTSLNIYPNPVSSIVNVNFNLKKTSEVQVELYNLLGSKMISDNLYTISGSQQHSMDVGNLPEGLYIMVINAGDDKVSRKVQIVK